VRLFKYSLGYLGFLTLLVFSIPDAGVAEPPQRAPLDTLWQEHMLAGSAATVYLDESGQRTVSIRRIPFDEQRGVPSVEFAAVMTNGIQVARLDERWLFWRNGGWVLKGGLLARAREESSAIELYGKAVIRQPPYIPSGPLPRDPPMTTGYEFFLLLRKANVPRATIVRQWTFQPDEVTKKDLVTARLQYNATTRTAKVTITGLKTDVEDVIEFPL